MASDILSIQAPLTMLNNTVTFDNDNDNNLQQSTTSKPKKLKKHGFSQFNLSTPTYKAIMSMGYIQPTPIQRKTIPYVLNGHDIIAQARTGSGKTAAFVIPMIEKLISRDSVVGCRALVLSPTRELAVQTYKVCKQLSKNTDIEYCLLVGGNTMHSQYAAIENKPDVIIATPGRLVHQLLEVKFNLHNVIYCVIDEADQLFEMNFMIQLNEVIRAMGGNDNNVNRQTMLFSATLPQQIIEFSRIGLKSNAQLIRLDNEHKISDTLKLYFFTVRNEMKLSALMYLLKYYVQITQQCIVFVPTKYHVELITALINAYDLTAIGIYGTMDATARKINLAKFRLKQCNILVVTDLAARGLDIPLLDIVINYDIPSKSKQFVHRVGRVARNGQYGVSYNICSLNELCYIYDLMLYLGMNIYSSDDTSITYEQHNNQQVIYGSMPSDKLELYNDTVNKLIQQNDLNKLINVCERALKLYNKSRSSASNASVQRVKAVVDNFHHIAIHPYFTHNNNDNDNSMLNNEYNNILKQISNFHSKQTIFEINNHVNPVMQQIRQQHNSVIQRNKQQKQAKQQQNNNDIELDDELSNSDNQQSDNDNNKTSHSDNDNHNANDNDDNTDTNTVLSINNNNDITIERKPRITTKQRKLGKQQHISPSNIHIESSKQANKQDNKSYKDSTYYISTEQPTHTEQQQNDIISLQQIVNNNSNATDSQLYEDPDTLLKSRKIEQWDTKKHKFITKTVGGDPFKKLRENSSTNNSKLHNGQISYKQWKTKQSNISQHMYDDDNNDSTQHNNSTYPLNSKKRKQQRDSDRLSHFKKQRSAADKQGKNELRNIDDIRKLRKTKQTNQLRNQKGGKYAKLDKEDNKEFTHIRGRNGQKYDPKRANKPKSSFKGGRGKTKR